jgi:acyl-CoA synthetase (AMP-forming)/AMP-acid ligase II
MRDPVVAAFDRLVARACARPLLVSPGRAALTVGALDGLSRALVARLAAAGLAPGALVGVACANGVGLLACVIALRRIGAAVLLLEPLGPAADTRRTAYALGAAGLIGCEDPWAPGPEAFSVEVLPPHPRPPQLAATVGFVKLSSGSTGAPRGVAVSSEAMLADEAALATTMGVGDHDRIVAAIPLSHSYGFASVVLPALVRGSLLVLPGESGPLSPLSAAREAEATVFPTVPAYLGAVLKMSKPPSWPASIRLVVSAGAPLPPETAARFREAYGRRVHSFYGASECGGICFDREGDAGERGTVGTPVDGVRVELTPVGRAGDEGVVSVTSAAAGDGYVPDAGGGLGGGCFRTSDIGCWRNGELKLLRRTDALINVKGKKVDPMEIESTLLGLCGVEEVVALGIPDPETGGHTVRVVIACRPGRLSYQEVLSFCRSRLADHKIPRSIQLVPEIPRTARGKIDRGALSEREDAHVDSIRR